MGTRILLYCLAAFAVSFALCRFGERSTTVPSKPDAVSRYETHLSALIANYDRMAELLEEVEDAESAEAICVDVANLCDAVRFLVVESVSLPSLTPQEALRLKRLCAESVHAELDAATKRLVDAAIRASEKAPRCPALLRLSDEFRSLSNDVNDFMVHIQGDA